MSEIKRDTLHWVPRTQVTTPPDHWLLRHFRSFWWVVNTNTDEVLLFRGRDGHDSPQANRSRMIAEQFAERYAKDGADGVVLIEHAFLPDEPERYR